MNFQNTKRENILLMQIFNKYTTGETINIDNIYQEFDVGEQSIINTLFRGNELQLLTINSMNNEITILNSLYKTEKCKRFSSHGGCLFDIDCLYLHPGKEEQIYQ